MTSTSVCEHHHPHEGLEAAPLAKGQLSWQEAGRQAAGQPSLQAGSWPAEVASSCPAELAGRQRAVQLSWQAGMPRQAVQLSWRAGMHA